MLYPKINWKKLDKNNPPLDLDESAQYLIFLRERQNDGERWNYWIDFWDTENDWIEGQGSVEVLAYAELGYISKTNIVNKKEIRLMNIRENKQVRKITVEEEYNGL